MKCLSEHVNEMYSGGWSVIYRKIISLFSIYLPLLLHALWAIPGVFILRCLRHWWIIRLGTIQSSRIGHFTADAGQQWAMRQQQSKKYRDLYWIEKTTCNEFWATMVRRNFPVYHWVFYLDRWNQIIPGGAIHHRPSSTTGSRDIYGWLEQMQVKPPFFPEEDTQAKDWLRQQGWDEGEPFVCLLVRDSHYLNNDSRYKDRAASSNGCGWDYHNYRDSDIATYVQAAEWLADQGVWVFRMGKSMAQPIPITHPKIIDFAFHPDRSDFLDVWLFAHCDLCISTGTGPDMISDIYRRPLLLLNFLPIQNLFSWSNAIHVPKNMEWEATGVPLTLLEHLNHSYFSIEQYQHAGIRIVDLNPEEINAAVQERWQRLMGAWIDSEDDEKLYHQFWEILKNIPDFNMYHGWIHPESRLGAAWIRSMGDKFLVKD